MKRSYLSFSTASFVALAIASLIFADSPSASSQTAETTLYTFLGSPDGDNPAAPVVFDKSGNLYGTLPLGGAYGYGAVFELSPEPAGGCPSGSNPGNGWCETILHNFAGNGDGILPSSGLILDSNGALYGETSYGGDANGVVGGSDAGAVFKLIPPVETGGPWKERILYSFCSAADCADGKWPGGGLIFDASGNLYGTASGGGLPATGEGYGAVFELVKPSGGAAGWKETVLYNFLGSYEGNSDGQNPGNGVILDMAGDLYGTTTSGGDYSSCSGGCGTVFKLPYNSGAYGKERILYAFQGTGDGKGPEGGLVFDSSGALYGTASSGGAYNNGNVFKLSPPTVQGEGWAESVLYSFQGFNVSPPDGYTPAGGVIFKGGDLYGTTAYGGLEACYVNVVNDGCGTVFKLIPPTTGSGTPWTERILWRIPGPQDVWPTDSLTLQGDTFYGTTGGVAGDGPCQYGCGGVFALAPAAATSITITSSLNPSIVGQPVTFMATVSTGSGSPTGTVTFVQNGTNTLGSVMLSGGQASLSKIYSSTGTRSITATYSGDPNFAGSTSSALSQVVNQATTTTTLVSSPNPSNAGESVSLTATVAPEYGGAPTGTVTFMENGDNIGTVTLIGGQAVLNKTFNGVGSKSLSAFYSGDSNFTTSTGTAMQTVQ